MRVAVRILVTDEQRATLQRWARGRSTPVRLMQRAQMVLQAADGKQNKEIADTVGVQASTVSRWRQRFAERGLAGIEKDAPRGGRRPTKQRHWTQRIIETTLHQTPPNATHWSVRTLAQHLGIRPNLVHRVWTAHQLKPHRIETFKLSRDPQFAAKWVDVVGLYLNPPEHAWVLCCDEKSQIQAWDRTQAGLPLKKGRCGTMTHDYKRHGTTTLFAALSLLDGKVIGDCLPRPRHQEWIKFLRLIEEQAPAGLALHLIVDPYHTHQHPQVKAWLQRHPRFPVHFLPTSRSWLHLVARWFREITDKRIRRGAFHSVRPLIGTIMDYIQHHHDNPKPFVWTAKADDILKKVARAWDALNVASE
jgi:transposase